MNTQLPPSVPAPRIWPPLPLWISGLRFLVACGVFYIVGAWIVAAMFDFFYGRYPRDTNAIRMLRAAVIVGPAALLFVAVYSRRIYWCAAPCIGWFFCLIGRRVYLSDEWLLDLEGGRWVVHQAASPFLARSNAMGFLKLYRDLTRLRQALLAGQLPRIRTLVLPAGFLSEEQIQRLGFRSRATSPHSIRARMKRWLVRCLDRSEMRFRSKLARVPMARDDVKYPFEAVVSRADFTAGAVPRGESVAHR